MKDVDLGRRELLARLGAGLGMLPFLPGARSYGAEPALPKRFVCVLQTAGYRIPHWLPSPGPLADKPLPDSTSPLEPHKGDLIFVTGLTNPGLPCTNCGHGNYGQLFSGTPAAVATSTYREAATPTVDQIVAEGLARKAPQLPVRSLALQAGVDMPGVPKQLGARRSFWRGLNDPVEPEADPRKVFDQLFAGKPDDPRTRRLRREQRTILDYVGGELERYGKSLGRERRQVVEAHLGSVREIERALAANPPQGPLSPIACGVVLGDIVEPKPVGGFDKLVDLHVRLTVAALACDVTRVVTLQLGSATGKNVVFDFIPGVPLRSRTNYLSAYRDWHDMSHNPLLNGVDHKRMVDKWCMEQFAALVRTMKETNEGTGSLLDHSVVLWANHMEQGEAHSTQRLPWILAGKCGGAFATGQHLATGGKPLNGVLAEICNAVDVPVEFFGDRAYGAPLPGLRA